MRYSILVILTALFFCLGLAPQVEADEIIKSYAFVQEDGSLKIEGKIIWLSGIYIPQTDRTCQTSIVPVKCGPRAILALDFKVRSGFVECRKTGEKEDGSITALCKASEEDLGSWMLKEGWAVALPDAPFEYQVLEKIAREQGRGIWGKVIGPP